MNLLFAVELDRRLRAAGVPVTAVACHPGIAATDLARHLPRIARGAWPLFGLILNTAAKGAWPTLQAATDPAVVPGGYYGPQRLGGAAGKSGLAPIAAVAQDREAARRLWELSIALSGVDPGLPPA
jgi:NAD(P)-dependent dehydrogenase (short-subunit alcohol dehydrogenase family)